MRVAGIDLSLTRTGLAEVDTDDGTWRTHHITSGAADDALWGQAERMDGIQERVLEFLFGVPDFAPHVVLIEGMSFGSQSKFARDIGGLWWGLIRALRQSPFDFELLVIAPATRAKYATGKGRGVGAGKSDVLAAVRATYASADVANHDVADAVALAGLGARINGFPVEQVDRAWVESEAAKVAAREAEKG